MDIIILPKVSESRNCIHLSVYILGAYLFLILILTLLVGYGAYCLGIKVQFAAQQQSLTQFKISAKNWKAVLGQQQVRLATLSHQAEEGLSTLTQRVGRLQAEMDRLNILGQRLIVHAGLDEGEFDFTNPPAMGGPELPQTEEAPKVNDFLATIGRLEQEIADRQQQLSLLETVLVERGMRQAALPAGRPLRHGWLSSKYGYRTDPFNGRIAFHSGLDFAGKAGTKILAVAAGVVTWSGKRSGYGNMVEINHGNGYVTRYAHNQKNLVQVGENVAKGQPIALVGSTGRSTGPHVHFEVLRNGHTVNPLQFVGAADNN